MKDIFGSIIRLILSPAIEMPIKRILLFRSKTDDTSGEDIYEKLLHDHGYEVQTISPIQFHFINQDSLATKLKSDDYDGLVFTSKRAVEAVQRIYSDDDRQRWQKIYVEGPATGAFVRETFPLSNNIRGADCGGSENLAELIIKDVQNVGSTMKLLFPCAQARLDMLPKRLSNDQGIILDEVIVYETIPSDTLDQDLNKYLQHNKTPDVLGFFSPSGFDSVLKASQRIGFDLTDNATVLISLGKTTSAAIRNSLGSASFNEHSCLKPTPEEFLRTVQSLN